MALRLLWGDLHRHSSEGDRREPLTKHFAVARGFLRLDFVAMTNCGILTRDPMDRSLMGPLQGKKSVTDGASMQHLGNLLDLHQVKPEHWALNQRLVREYTEPGRFVPLLAYEWSCARYGDRNVFYRSPDEPMRLAKTLPQLYRELEQIDALLIPHHPGYAVGRRGVDWSTHHPRLERLVEIVSNHGCSEEPRGGIQPLQNIGMGSNVPGTGGPSPRRTASGSSWSSRLTATRWARATPPMRLPGSPPRCGARHRSRAWSCGSRVCCGEPRRGGAERRSRWSIW